MSLVRVLLVGLVAYVALISALRVGGKRTLSKLNAFDLVVTVALGSTFATIPLSKDVALLEGVLAFATLASLQFVVAWSSKRSSVAENLAKSKPRTLLSNGRFQEDAMMTERITREEVMAAVRGSGHGNLGKISAVVLETNGSLSVVPSLELGDRLALANLQAEPMITLSLLALAPFAIVLKFFVHAPPLVVFITGLR